MNGPAALRAVPPGALATARAHAHRAVQPLSLAARANLAARADDGHSNLGWIDGRLETHPLGGGTTVALDMAALAYEVRQTGAATTRWALDGAAPAEARAWLDAQLAQRGLRPIADATPPYALPAEVGGIERFREDPGLAALAAWFALADDGLRRAAATLDDVAPGPSPVRCWPHHFDIATYVSLEAGDAETARGVGVGLSPGDESYGQPYVYVTPWPPLRIDRAPDAPAPGRWHVEGFVGMVATAEALGSTADPRARLDGFLRQAIAIARERLGA